MLLSGLSMLWERTAPEPALEERFGFSSLDSAGPRGPLSVTVLPEAPGDWLDIANPSAVRAAGAVLARLHHALGVMDTSGWPQARERTLGAQIHTWLDDRDPGFAPEASRRLRDALGTEPELVDVPQLVHNDLRAANILTRGSQIVAVLDFDDVHIDHRVVDLAKASTYLGTRFTAWKPTPARVQRELREGYESVRPMSAAEKVWLPIVTMWHGIAAIPGEDDPGGWAAAL